MESNYSTPDSEAWSCIGCIGVLLFNLIIGSYCFNYCFDTLFGHQLPWFVSGICGLIFGELAILAAIAFWLINTFGGMSVPWIH